MTMERSIDCYLDQSHCTGVQRGSWHVIHIETRTLRHAGGCAHHIAIVHTSVTPFMHATIRIPAPIEGLITCIPNNQI